METNFTADKSNTYESNSLQDQQMDEELKLTNLSNNQIEMLEKLSKIPDIRVKNQLISETDLTNEEKFDKLKEALIDSPINFLTRFGKYLESEQLKCFDDYKDANVNTCLIQLRKNLAVAKVLRKNRRYAALQKLVETTEYFSEEEMQRRNPILYDQLVGKFQSKEEKDAFIQRSYQTASTSNTPLTDLLMAHMNRNEDGESYRRLDQEKQKADEEEADAEYEENEDEEMDDGRYNVTKNGGGREDEEGEEIEEDEKELFKEEFYTTMYQHFLDGKDIDFDYSNVDNNEEYDVGENLDQDEEEKYFDNEEPCEVSCTEINNELSEPDERMFKPPVRCKDIESKIKTLSVKQPSESKPKEIEEGIADHNNEEEEDELDAYMKSIEQKLQNH